MSLRIQEESPMRYPTNQVIDEVRQVLAKLPHAAHHATISTDRITQTVSQGSDPRILWAFQGPFQYRGQSALQRVRAPSVLLSASYPYYTKIGPIWGGLGGLQRPHSFKVEPQESTLDNLNMAKSPCCDNATVERYTPIGMSSQTSPWSRDNQRRTATGKAED